MLVGRTDLMSRKLNRVAKVIATGLAGAMPVGDAVIFVPLGHIAKGYLFENTRYKNAYYLWNFTFPLFTPLSTFTLNYSHRVRLRGDLPMRLLIDDENQAAMIQSILSRLQNLASPESARRLTVQQFLNEFPLTADNSWRPNLVLENAIAKCLTGDVVAGRELLGQLQEMSPENSLTHEVKSDALEVITHLELGSSSFLKLIAKYEATNIARHFPGLAFEPRD